MSGDDISLRHLRVLIVLLEVGSLTRAAQLLETTQPTVSKILARLRLHFGDPLFVRVGLAMRPTPKAIALAQPLRELLTTSAAMRASAASFDPRASAREFSVIVTEVGMIALLPPLMSRLEGAGAGLRLKAVPLDARRLEVLLEAGEADLALGAFPAAAPGLRRQPLYADPYVSVARRGHPRLGELTRAEGFLRERHIIVTASNAGHAAHRTLDRALNARLAPGRVQVRVPSFVTSAFVASCTDAIGTLPEKLAECLAGRLGLAVFPTPLPLPGIEIGQFWHERVHRDPGHRWFRAAVRTLFGAAKPRSGGATAPAPADPAQAHPIGGAASA
ncbi:MAG: LysR substrate-binding domain-containing protein [Stellaceae bacterium]